MLFKLIGSAVKLLGIERGLPFPRDIRPDIRIVCIELKPFLQTGLRVGYDGFSRALWLSHVRNGWQISARLMKPVSDRETIVGFQSDSLAGPFRATWSGAARQAAPPQRASLVGFERVGYPEHRRVCRGVRCCSGKPFRHMDLGW